MIQAKHTPGPWTIETSNEPIRHQRILGADGIEIVRFTRALASPYDNAREDAALIASAPELLEALKSATTLIGQMIEMGGMPYDTISYNKKAREIHEALAKAERQS